MFLTAVSIVGSMRWTDLWKSKLFRFSVCFKSNCALRLKTVKESGCCLLWPVTDLYSSTILLPKAFYTWMYFTMTHGVQSHSKIKQITLKCFQLFLCFLPLHIGISGISTTDFSSSQWYMDVVYEDVHLIMYKVKTTL